MGPPFENEATDGLWSRWAALCGRLGIGPAGERIFRMLCEAYGASGRAYHDLGHVADALAAFDMLRGVAEDADSVELALWFHDAVYDPRERDNEARSAALAFRTLVEAGLAPERAGRVRDLVLVTRHDARPEEPDGAVVADADLAVLGQDAERYGAYEEAIRLEYGWVEGAAFRRGRSKILRSFLDREWIFATEPARERYEEKARENLKLALRRLEGPTGPRG